MVFSFLKPEEEQLLKRRAGDANSAVLPHRTTVPDDGSRVNLVLPHSTSPMLWVTRCCSWSCLGDCGEVRKGLWKLEYMQEFGLCVCQECDPVKIKMKTQVLSWNCGVGAELKICSTRMGLSHFMVRILMFGTRSQQLSNVKNYAVRVVDLYQLLARKILIIK